MGWVWGEGWPEQGAALCSFPSLVSVALTVQTPHPRPPFFSPFSHPPACLESLVRDDRQTELGFVAMPPTCRVGGHVPPGAQGSGLAVHVAH